LHHVAVDGYVLDVLMPDLAGHEHSPSAFLGHLALWAGLFRAEQGTIAISLGRLSTRTGLSKSAVHTEAARIGSGDSEVQYGRAGVLAQFFDRLKKF
jgi:hypothetical protein